MVILVSIGMAIMVSLIVWFVLEVLSTDEEP